MRKKLVCAVALLLAILLCACEKSEEAPMTEEFGQASVESVGGEEETAAAEPEEIAAAEPAEVELVNEDNTDAPSEEERESWNPRSVHRLRTGDDAEESYSAIRQGNTIYLASQERLAKIPLGGGVDSAKVLLDRDFTGSNKILEIQAVGEWIYIRTDEEGNAPYNINSLWRLRTDGTGLERITDILATDDSERNTFAVIGDQLYLSCMTSERRSAKEYYFTSTLYCYQLDTGVATELYQTYSTSSSMNLIICSYNEKSLLLMDFSQDQRNPVLLIYEYGADAPIVAPEALQAIRKVFYDDMTGTGSYLAECDEKLYRISPENSYLPEELPIQLFTEEEAARKTRDRLIRELLVLDGQTLVYSYWIPGLGAGLRLYQNGTLTDINSDGAVQLDYPGDGYLYYAYYSNFHYHYCRVQLDGTGWEQFNWELGSNTAATANSYD